MKESEIKAPLIALLDGIKTADGTVIASKMEQLDLILQQHRRELHPQLAHFLERRSYAKALDYLGGAEVPAAKCGGKESRG
jgi:hypothetical protein